MRYEKLGKWRLVPESKISGPIKMTRGVALIHGDFASHKLSHRDHPDDRACQNVFRCFESLIRFVATTSVPPINFILGNRQKNLTVRRQSYWIYWINFESSSSSISLSEKIQCDVVNKLHYFIKYFSDLNYACWTGTFDICYRYSSWQNQNMIPNNNTRNIKTSFIRMNYKQFV